MPIAVKDTVRGGPREVLSWVFAELDNIFANVEFKFVDEVRVFAAKKAAQACGARYGMADVPPACQSSIVAGRGGQMPHQRARHDHACAIAPRPWSVADPPAALGRTAASGGQERSKEPGS